ncbi:MAG: IS21 family transposase [Aminivibrio sp.]|jgi:transposase
MDAKSVNLSASTNQGLAGDGEIIQECEVSTIIGLHKRGWKIRAIARELGVSRNTVRKYLRNGGVHEYQKPERRGVLYGMEEWLKERFIKHNGNGDVIRQELEERGISVSLRTVERAVKEYRDDLRREGQATVRFETPPGHQLQIDFGEKRVLIGGERVRVHIFTAKLGYSRRIYLEAFERENQGAWFGGLEGAFRYFGGIPQEILIDNPGSLVKKHDRSTGEFELNEKFRAFANYWGFTPRACAPGRACTKGKVESGVKYGKNNCLAGREFPNWYAMERHISAWLVGVSDGRALTDKTTRPGRVLKLKGRSYRPLTKPLFSSTGNLSAKYPGTPLLKWTPTATASPGNTSETRPAFW